MQINVVTVHCANAVTYLYNMKKGEGTINVGKRGTLENGGGSFTAFHRPGDQSLAKNIYFPRQLNGYHMVSQINKSFYFVEMLFIVPIH